MKKYGIIIIVLLLHSVDASAKQYTSVEDIFSDDSVNITKMGFPGRKKGCQEFINNWVEKLTSYINNNPVDPRAYFFRGYFTGFKPGCWRKTDTTIKAFSREAYLASPFLENNNKLMNEDWADSLAANENTSDKTKQLSWFMLNSMFNVFMAANVVEKKEKLRIKIATPENLGAGTEHPIDKNTFILKQYEKIADNYNYVDDRENVTRILNELAQVSPEGAVKVNELVPMYEKAWQKRDVEIAQQQKNAAEEAIQAAKSAQPQTPAPSVASAPEFKSASPQQQPVVKAEDKPQKPKAKQEANNNQVIITGIVLAVLLLVGFMVARRKKK